jgi:hypothetical protein
MKISSGGIQITTAHTVLTASEVAGEGSTANKSSSAAIEITLNAITGLYADRLNSDGNYYGITFPGDYIGIRGGSKDPFWVAGARSGTGPIDYSGGINVILNIPVGVSIGANTSGTFGSEVVGGAGAFAGARYELRSVWDSSWSGSATNGSYLSDPSLIINLDTDEWDAATLGNLNITINNSGNTIGAGGSGGYGSRTKFGGGGGGGGQGLHPAWGAGAAFESTDNFSSGDWGAGQAGSGYKVGQSGGGASGVQGTLNVFGAGGAVGGSDAGIGGPTVPAGGHAGGTAIYIKSNVATSVTGTTITIANKSTGRMYGGGGGGTGGHSLAGAAGGDMTTQGASGGSALFNGVVIPGGWQGSILWVDSANLAVTNTITNDSSIPISGWDGTWT